MHIIILAGGGGTRLWPFSRLDYPKQFLHFQDEHSLLQKTILRCLKISCAKNICVITSAQYVSLVEEQIEALSPKRKIPLLVEPMRKNTAPAICLGLKYLEQKLSVKPEEKILVLPSDHLISPEEDFVKIINEIDTLDLEKKLLVFGILPTDPETGYGYIKTKEKKVGSFYPVERFIEKPILEKAEEFVLDGSYYWNSGMFCFSSATFFEEIALYSPELNGFCQSSYSTLFDQFAKMPSISIDCALMEHSKALVMKPLLLQWSDVGSWDSVYKVLEKDPNLNVKMGNVLDIDTTNSLIFGDKRLISTIGLDDMLIVETADALFLAKKGKSQEVKTLVESLQKKGVKQEAFLSKEQEKWVKKTPYYSLCIFIIAPHESKIFETFQDKSTVFEVLMGKARFTDLETLSTFHETHHLEVKGKKTIRIDNLQKKPLEILHLERELSS